VGANSTSPRLGTSVALNRASRFHRGIIVAMPMMERGGSVVRDLAFNNDADINGTIEDTWDGQGLSFEVAGTNYARLNRRNGLPIMDSTGTQPLTIALWFKQESQTDGRVFSESRNALDPRLSIITFSGLSLVGCEWRSNSKTVFNTTNCNFGGGLVGSGRWHHLVLVVNAPPSGRWVYAYTDGGLSGLFQYSSSGRTTTTDFTEIGSSKHFLGPHYSDGSVADFKAWRRALSAREARDLYNDEARGNWDIYRGSRGKVLRPEI
jgi:hypothetical protein